MPHGHANAFIKIDLAQAKREAAGLQGDDDIGQRRIESGHVTPCCESDTRKGLTKRAVTPPLSRQCTGASSAKMQNFTRAKILGDVVNLRTPEDRSAGATASAIAAWMQRVMAEHDMSALAWSKRAGISDTSISRFLKHGAPVPKAVTIARMASALSLPAPQFSANSQDQVDIPVILASLLWHQGKAVACMSATSSVRAARRSAAGFALRVTANTAPEAGVLVNDIVIVSDTLSLKAGALVAVIMEDGTTGVFEYNPPFLMPRGSPMPIPRIDSPAHRIAGTVVELRRDMA